MPFSEHSADPDAGMSYHESSNAVQRLLDKLKKRPRQGGMMPVLGKDQSDQLSNKSYADLSSKLDNLIEFADVNPAVIESVWRRLKKVPPGKISMPKKEFKEEHQRLLKVLKQKDPAALAKERAIQSKEMRKELSIRLDNLIQFQSDPRPRNNLGEFAPQQEGGPDPNAMVKTYRIAPSQPGMSPNKEVGNGKSLLGLGGLAVVGGAAGGFGGSFGSHFGKMALEKVGKAIKQAKKLRK